MTDATQSKRPTHHAYAVREGKEKNYFTRIGAAWRHKSGNGFNIELEIVPSSGRIVLFAADKKRTN
jgi:hypothetical protein